MRAHTYPRTEVARIIVERQSCVLVDHAKSEDLRIAHME